jgi:hypothetical protein
MHSSKHHLKTFIIIIIIIIGLLNIRLGILDGAVRKSSQVSDAARARSLSDAETLN